MNTIIRASLSAVFAAGMLAGGAAFGQTAVPTAAASTAQPNSQPPAIRGVSSDSGQHPTGPVAGENSFTQSEVVSRLQANGIANVANLKLDSQSIWRGTGVKDGKQVAVAVDYQGNIFVQ